MTIKAKFAGTCKACGRKISVGDEIEWAKTEGARHLNCETRKSNPANAESNGTKIYSVDNFEYAAEPGYVFPDNGRWLTVISSSGFYTEDPLSFGKMDGEDGYIYDWKCRDATATEIAIAEGKQQAAKQKDDLDRAARIAKNQAEKAEYEANRSTLIDLRDKLIADNGLVKVKSVPSVEGSKHEDLGSSTPAGKGFSWTWFLSATRDSEGNLLYVSWSNEEAGTTYWGTEEIKRAGESVERVCQYWREGVYHNEDYPGPSIPREELTADELREVERLETQKYEACIAKQGWSWQNWINRNTSNGSVQPSRTRLLVSVPKTASEAAEKEKAHLESLSGSGWSATYNDPNRREYYQLRPLQVEINTCAPAASFHEEHFGGGTYDLVVTFPVKPEPAVLKALTAAGFEQYKSWGGTKVRPNAYSARAFHEYEKVDRKAELKAFAEELIANYNL